MRIAGIALTALDGGLNTWENLHTADLIVGGVQTFLIGTGPISWAIGLAYFDADLITMDMTGKSITENLFDH